MLEIAQPTVNDLQAVSRGLRPEIRLLNERDMQPARGGLPRERRPVNPAADDQHVVMVRGQRRQIPQQLQLPGQDWESAASASPGPTTAASRSSRSSTVASYVRWLYLLATSARPACPSRSRSAASRSSRTSPSANASGCGG